MPEWLFELEAAHQSALPTPVRIPAPPDAPAPPSARAANPQAVAWRLLPEGNGLPADAGAPAQFDGEAFVALLPGPLPPRARYRLVQAPASRPASPAVRLREEGPHALSILVPEGLVTTYRFDPALPRPFCFPLLGPDGKAVTRSYPMEMVPGETRDHPHHRSLWTAYGEVNGVDDWSEMPGHGFIRHQRFLRRWEGPAFGGFTAATLWTAADGRPLLDERRTLRVYNAGPDRRLIDYEVELTASHGEVRYGDTKEGGLLAIRVATSMDGNRGGRIENSQGAVGEKQAWGKRAAWLDYSGPIDGRIYGIAMMDHPANFRHPCYWHARDYGLVGTNPFAKAAFEGGAKRETVQARGETLRFRYRLLLHRGNAAEARVDDAFHAWIMAPAAAPAR